MLSRIATLLFVSLQPESLGQEQRDALKQALKREAVPSITAEPVGWMDTTCPGVWQFGQERREYDWFLA